MKYFDTKCTATATVKGESKEIMMMTVAQYEREHKEKDDKLAAVEKRERELREKVEDFLSCERIIRDAGIMDNYTDAARARNRQAAIINEWKQLLGGEK